jgi:hypothetical protein
VPASEVLGKGKVYPRTGHEGPEGELRDVDEICGHLGRRVVIVYRRFGTTYRTHLHGSRVRVGP